MTLEDVKVYILYRKDPEVGNSDLNHDISALSQSLMFCGNPAVTVCLQKNMGLKPSVKRPRTHPNPRVRTGGPWRSGTRSTRAASPRSVPSPLF